MDKMDVMFHLFGKSVDIALNDEINDVVEAREQLKFSELLPLHLLQTISLYLMHDVALFNWDKVDSIFHGGFEKASKLYKRCLEENWYQLTGERRFILSMTSFSEELACFQCAPSKFVESVSRGQVKVMEGTKIRVSEDNSDPIGTINVCTRSDHPIPRAKCFTTLLGGHLVHHSKLLGYFEVSVPEMQHGEMISVGLTSESYQFHRCQVGWGRFTPTNFAFGWHSDDNGIFMCSSRNLLKTEDEFPHTQNAVVGIGVQRLNGGPYSEHGFIVIFLTCNGRIVRFKKPGVLPSRQRTGIALTNLYDLYPAVGLDTSATVEANFGAKPFVYDVANHNPDYFSSRDCYVYTLDHSALSR